MKKIFCIGVSGRPISEKLSEVLFYNAHDMFETGDTETFVKGKDYDGKINTEFKRAGLGPIFGVIFHAVVMTLKGETKVNYLVRDRDLDGIESVKFRSNYEELEDER